MSFTCPRCARTSHSPEDERQGYCGACCAFTVESGISAAPRPVIQTSPLGFRFESSARLEAMLPDGPAGTAPRAAGPPEYGCPRCGVRFEVPPDHIGPVLCATYGCAGAPMTEITPRVLQASSFDFHFEQAMLPDGLVQAHAEPGFSSIAVSADAVPGTLSFECPVAPIEAPQPRPYSWADTARMLVERLRSGQTDLAGVMRYIRERYAPSPAESLAGRTITASGTISPEQFGTLMDLFTRGQAPLPPQQPSERFAELIRRNEALIAEARAAFQRPYSGQVTTAPYELPPEEEYGAYRWQPGDPEW